MQRASANGSTLPASSATPSSLPPQHYTNISRPHMSTTARPASVSGKAATPPPKTSSNGRSYRGICWDMQAIGHTHAATLGATRHSPRIRRKTTTSERTRARDRMCVIAADTRPRRIRSCKPILARCMRGRNRISAGFASSRVQTAVTSVNMRGRIRYVHFSFPH
jgi:hypothetical protein